MVIALAAWNNSGWDRELIDWNGVLGLDRPFGLYHTFTSVIALNQQA